MEIDGKWIHGDRPEDVEKYVAQEQAKLEERKKSLKLFIEKQAGGFGWAAMENKDLEAAEALIAEIEQQFSKIQDDDEKRKLNYDILELKTDVKLASLA